MAARRGVLEPPHGRRPGSPWWRAVNDRLLRDGCEAVALSGQAAGRASSPTVSHWIVVRRPPDGRDLVRRPTPASWPPTWKTAIWPRPRTRRALLPERGAVPGPLRARACRRAPARPRLASSGSPRCSADPRLGMTGIFLQLARVLPDAGPAPPAMSAPIVRRARVRPPAGLRGDHPGWISSTRGQIAPARPPRASGPGSRRGTDLAWPFEDREVWRPGRSLLLRAARRALPPGA